MENSPNNNADRTSDTTSDQSAKSQAKPGPNHHKLTRRTFMKSSFIVTATLMLVACGLLRSPAPIPQQRSLLYWNQLLPVVPTTTPHLH